MNVLGHASDCAVHDAPAYNPGNCDCGLEKDTLHGCLKCLICGAQIEFYTDNLTKMVEHMRALVDEMLNHIQNNHMVPEGTHQPRKDEANG